jgi:hypothetical protein
MLIGSQFHGEHSLLGKILKTCKKIFVVIDLILQCFHYFRALKSKYGVSGIPCLVVVKKDGTIITKDGRSDVHRFGASCFQQWANA